MKRARYAYAVDDAPGHPYDENDATFSLPPCAAMLPSEEAFGLEKKTRLALHKLVLKLQNPIFLGMPDARRLETERDYRRSLGFMRRPAATWNWQNDEQFGALRLTGTNPMAIEHCTELPEGKLAEAANRVLSTRYGTNLGASQDRLFRTYRLDVLDKRVQRQVTKGATLVGAECLFYVTNESNTQSLMPLAIELRDRNGASSVTTPLHKKPAWLLAKAHANCADSHYHEGVIHLLETHMVSEVFKLATSRHLHPDHPVHQLLDPHFEDNLAIDHLARRNLLSTGGPIDLAMAAGVGGTLDLARLHWKSWSFEDRRFQTEIATRGVSDPKALPYYPYRDDGLELHSAIDAYARGVLRTWYASNDDVSADYELKAWCQELTQKIPDFPSKIHTTEQLYSILTDVIFRASVQHSAVNNGQFDTYGFTPNSPGTVYSGILTEADAARLEEIDVMRSLPRLRRSLAQLGMSWVLSQATHRSLYASGECPAFSREICRPAYEEVQAFRERLRGISRRIDRRNESVPLAYTYLNPHNIGRSTGI